MFTIILSLADDNIWNSYFKSQFVGEQTNHCQNCNLSAGKGQYYLDECNFFDDNDRVIYFSSITNTLFLHNRCSFSKCTSTSSGSCIYFKIGSNSSIVQRKFCCTKCQSQSGAHFSYTLVDKDNLNFIIESSLFDVGKKSVGCSIWAERDNIIVSSTNFSSCKASLGPAGFLKSPNVNYTTKYNYTTVVNNLATSNMILSIWNNSLIDSCNIINNTIATSDFGIIIYHSDNSLTVKSCSFINNTAPQGSYLIYNDGNDQLTVDSCYIDNSISSTFLRNVVPKNTRKLFTNNLTHLSTDICQAEFAIIKKRISEVNRLPIIIISLVNIKRST